MLTDQHSIEIMVNGERVDIYSSEKLNLRINNVIYDPVSVSSKTGEYSFSFSLPSTPTNDRIFNYANNSAKLNKFTLMHKCQVIADGITIFDGVLRLTESQTKDYKCNLVNVKVNNIEDIFGEMKMNEITWEIPFDGTEDIDKINKDVTSDVFLPLICYGAFPKFPYATYNNGQINYYSELTKIDDTNQWYWESFKPSFRLTALVRKYFEAKGYHVSGDFFDDTYTNDIFLSTYISDKQDPYMNLNNDNVGRLVLYGNFNNYGSYRNGSYIKGAPRTTQDLSFPRDQVTNGSHKFDEYNFDRIFIYDILGTSNQSTYHTGLMNSINEYLFRYTNDEKTKGYIYIPTTGLYHIRLSINNLGFDLESETMKYNIIEGKYSSGQGYYTEEKQVSMPRNWSNCPVEFHLLRNSTETELIGSADPLSGNPPLTNYVQYPHEMDYTKITGSTRGTSTAGGHDYGGTRGTIDPTGGGRTGTGIGFGGNRSMGTAPEEMYYQTLGGTICYDPWVNPNFICGMTSLNRSCAVIKNGGSWNPECGDYNQSHFNCGGYRRVADDGTQTLSDYNLNTLVDGENYFQEDGGTALHKNGVIDCVVELNAGDTITLAMVTRCNRSVERTTTSPTGGTRGTTGDSDYMLQCNYTIVVEPYTPNVDKYVGKNYMLNRTPTEQERKDGFGIDWKLHNYLHAEEKVADFINNVIKTFNLSYNADGDNIRLDFNKRDDVKNIDYIDIDDRVNTDDATFQRIDFPSYMEVKFAIDDSEAGAYRSIDTIEHQGASNWKDYIDTGSEKVVMDMTDTTNASTVESKFSYNWFQDFEVDDKRFVDRPPGIWSIPLIAKDENFIIQNEDSVAKDGLSLKQRLWWRGYPESDKRVQLWNGKVVFAVVPPKTYNNVESLDFKNHAGSMLDKYFNITPATESNFCEIEAYITPDEYIRLKNGAMVKFDDNLHIICEIVGFDPSCTNKTTLKLMTKTQ